MKAFKLLAIAASLMTLCFDPSIHAMKRGGGNRIMAPVSFDTLQADVLQANDIANLQKVTEAIREFVKFPTDQRDDQAQRLQTMLKQKIYTAINSLEDLARSIEDDLDASESINEQLEELDRLQSQIDEL